MTIDTTGWTTIGAISAGVVTVATLFINQYFQFQREKLRDAKLDRIAEVGKKTAAAVNGQLTGSLVTGAVSARALAMADPNALNHDLAAAATKIATDHLAAQAATAASDAAAAAAAKIEGAPK